MVWVYVWLGVLALSLIVEFVSMELVSIWVSVGSLVAMILALCNVSITIQLVVFGVVTIACILGLRRIAMKFLFRNKGKTNLDVIIGTTHKLIKKVNEEELGAVKINGVEWSVKSENDVEIEAGNFVEVVSVEGNKFIVKKSNAKKLENKESSKINPEQNTSIEKNTNIEKSSNNNEETNKDELNVEGKEKKSKQTTKKTSKTSKK